MSEVDIDALPRAMYVFIQFMWEHGKKTSVWCDVGEGPNDGTPMDELGHKIRVYAVNRKSGTLVKSPGRPGTVYLVPYEEDDGAHFIYGAAAEFQGIWKCQDDVIKWQSVHDSHRREHESHSKTAKEKRRNYPAEGLEPYRRAYWSMPARDRQQFLAYIMYEVTKGFK
jgi:hypothetical protein